jgi:signal peptidase I
MAGAKGGFSRYQSYTVQKKRREQFLGALVLILLVYVGYLVLTAAFVRTVRYDSKAMQPTLNPGAAVLVSPLPLGQSHLPFLPFGLPGWRGPQRGELVLLVPPYRQETAPWTAVADDAVRFFTLQMVSLDAATRAKWDGPFTLRRVIGLPGDTVKIENFTASVKPKGEAYFMSEYELSKTPYSLTDDGLPQGWRSTFPYGANLVERVLGDDEYFVLADNRSVGGDSRTWGPVKRADIQATAVLKYWPPQDFGRL